MKERSFLKYRLETTSSWPPSDYKRVTLAAIQAAWDVQFPNEPIVPAKPNVLSVWPICIPPPKWSPFT
jgi:hypothetical protein